MIITMVVDALHRLLPYGAEEEARMAKLGEGEMVQVDVKVSRNPYFHRRFWAMIGWLFENVEHNAPSRYLLHQILLIKSGHCDTVISPDGSTTYVPRRTNYADMDQSDFEDVYADVLTAAHELYAPFMTPTQIAQLLEFE